MTVARYYTPSGRLIQTPYEDGDQADYLERKFDGYDSSTFDPVAYADSVPDSLKFKTANGRIVFGGGGVLPDYVVPRDTSGTMRVIVGNGFDAVFGREWFADNENNLRRAWTDKQPEFLAQFSVSQRMWDEFISFMEENGVKATSNEEEVSLSDGVISRRELREYRPQLETYLKGRIAQELYGSRAWFDVYQSVDPELQAALELWDRAQLLAEYHAR